MNRRQVRLALPLAAAFAAILAAAVPAAAGAQTSRADNGLARTPPMGWNSWNHFGCDVSARLVREVADAMAANGMRDAGYAYVTIDDCWQVARDARGVLIADSARFPGGMKPLADYVHAKGLKFGIYTDAGRKTCQGRPGSYGHEALDARTFAGWGVDYVKVDWCWADGLDARTQYATMRDALLAAGRPIVFSICEWGENRPWEWGPGTGNLWRTTDDISDNWNSLLSNVNISMQFATAARPGAWNDPDMLEVGNGGMTRDEYRAHFSLWAMMAAPLIAGNDVRQLSDSTRRAGETRDILLNREVIAVDQDSIGRQAIVVQSPHPDLQVWARPLADGARAVLLFNRAPVQTTIHADWRRVGIRTKTARVRDLWAHKELGVLDGYSAMVPAHGVVMLRVTPIDDR
ncbi:MAG: glycoside hydrolase family 27 protein [Chloroflexota bacterium]|nr:glycoside hydrolase family 27 protein [Chloroflexota bacterium]